MNHQNIDHNPERISELKPFISNYNWKDIEFPSHLKDWKKFECNNKTTALNILFVPYKKKNTSKQNNEQDNTKKQNNERGNTKEIRQVYMTNIITNVRIK